MKKVLLSIFAVAALASCFQNEELVGVGGDKPIAFDNAYVGGATKAIDNSFNNDNLDLFQVYGTVTANGATSDIFRGVEVRKANGVWAYDEEHTQYWMAGNTYSFKAVVAGNEAGATEVVLGQHYMPTAIKVLDAEAQKDVLYSEVLNVNYHSNLQPVRFTFKHLLAKAKVTVKNVIPTQNGGYYVVENVYLKDAHKTATYTIGEGWASQAGAYDLLFGNIVAKGEKNENADAIQLGLAGEGASNYERLIIPQDNCELTIVVSYKYYDKNNFAHKTVENQEIKTIANIEAGKAYNFVLTLAEPGEKIEFDVEDVTEWVEGGVKTAADLQAAINNGGTIFLAEDVILEETLVIPAGKSVVLNLNGHTISQEKACTASYEMIANNGELTIMGNGKLSFKDTGAGDPAFGWGSYTIRNSGTLVVEDGVIEHLGVQDFATHMICAIFQYSGSTTINGGVISTPNYRSARLWHGSMTINGGKFNGQLWVQAVDNSSVLTVNGGSFAPVGGDGSSIFVTNSEHTVNLAVNGGYFNTKIGTSVPSKDGVKGAIKGGSFTESAKENTNAALLAAGYSFVEENGVWKVIKASFVSTPEALAAAIAAKEATIYVQGEIDLKDVILSGYNGTIIGVDRDACLNTRNFTPSADEAYQLRSQNIIFKDIDFKLPRDIDWIKSGFVGTGNITFENCDFEGQVTLNGQATWAFNKCRFFSLVDGKYPSFVYGAKKATFTDCSFKGVDRAAKVYASGGAIEAEYNNCTFTSETSDKYAVNIDASCATTKVALNGCSQTGMPGLYAVEGAANATVLVDGVQQ